MTFDSKEAAQDRAVRWRKGPPPKDGTVVLLRGTGWSMRHGNPQDGMMLVRWNCNGHSFEGFTITLNDGVRSDMVCQVAYWDLGQIDWVPLGELLPPV